MNDMTETLAEILKSAGGPKDASKLLDEAGSEASCPAALQVAVPEKMKVVDLTEAVDRLATKLQPWRRAGTAHMGDLESLIEWSNRHKGESSVLFATPGENPSLTCIADYIGAGEPVMDAHSRDPNASYMRHRATYKFPLSEEWKAWMAVHGKALDKAEFGEFIESNADDLMDPTPALLGDKQAQAEAEPWEQKMLEVARQLQGRFGQYGELIRIAREFTVNEVSNLTTTLNRDTGESSIQFLDQHQQPDGTPIKIPNLLMIAIPVFDNGAAYRIPVRFRYRKSGPNVRFILTMHNARLCLRDAFNEALEAAREQTGLQLFIGSPEA